MIPKNKAKSKNAKETMEYAFWVHGTLFFLTQQKSLLTIKKKNINPNEPTQEQNHSHVK